MKRILYFLAAALTLTMVACGPKEDPTMKAMDTFMDAQSLPGLYTKSVVDYAFNEDSDQCYFSKSSRTFRIMDATGDKYLQFTLSADPVEGQTVDVVAKSYGLGLSSNTNYNGLMVNKIENDLCYLRSDADGGYVGIIIYWID